VTGLRSLGPPSQATGDQSAAASWTFQDGPFPVGTSDVEEGVVFVVCGQRFSTFPSCLAFYLFFFLAKVRRKTKLVRTVLAIKVSWPGWIG